MFEWSDTDLMVRDAVRQFIDKEIRPHQDALETGELSPYPIARKLFSQFGLDVLLAESVNQMLDGERAKREKRDSSGSFGLADQASEAATDVAMEAVQLFGGNGYMAEYRVEQLARDAKSLMIYAGSNEVQVTHIAKGLLGEPASRA